MSLYENIDSILIPAEKIQKAVKILGKQITKDYADQKLLVICILKGSIIFFSDLIRYIDLPVSIDFMVYSSYKGGLESNHNIQLIQDLSSSIENRHVIVVEDIIDSGNTLHALIGMLERRNPKSLAIATLLNKTARREVEVPVKYCCFDIPDEFVVGYGMDFGAEELYRNLPDICVLKKEIYSKAL